MISLGVIKHSGLQWWCFGWLFCKAKSVRGHREGADKGYKKIFLFGLGRFHQNQTHPSPKGNAKASFTWHRFLIQGPKGLPATPSCCQLSGVGEDRAGAHQLQLLYLCEKSSSSPPSARKKDLGEIWHKNLHRRVYQANTLSRRPRRKMMEQTLRCPLSSSPKRHLQDPESHSTLSSCEQPMKSHEILQIRPDIKPNKTKFSW